MWLENTGKKDGTAVTLTELAVCLSVALYLSPCLPPWLSFLNLIIAIILILVEQDASKEICMLCLKFSNAQCIQHVREEVAYLFILFFKDRFYLLILREGKGRRKRGRGTSMCGCLSWAPDWGPGPQPRRVPWLGIKLATVWFAGCYSIRSGIFKWLK